MDGWTVRCCLRAYSMCSAEDGRGRSGKNKGRDLGLKRDWDCVLERVRACECA